MRGAAGTLPVGGLAVPVRSSPGARMMPTPAPTPSASPNADENTNASLRPRPRPRAATYRVQLHAGFTFDDAAAITGYLAELGVSHLYCSPVLQAAAGSTAGYD